MTWWLLKVWNVLLLFNETRKFKENFYSTSDPNCSIFFKLVSTVLDSLSISTQKHNAFFRFSFSNFYLEVLPCQEPKTITWCTTCKPILWASLQRKSSEMQVLPLLPINKIRALQTRHTRNRKTKWLYVVHYLQSMYVMAKKKKKNSV